ncbi:MAG: phosphatidylserine/phosphatidylglycerophosphate/cardiolipin synthase family protein [Deltaproteobacteria bacterium]|nr:phosphatidylserine/phosphatidylglycerophosphate/cardiolipin synthase family protein [Deltaproteobacteria bacterium]
MIFNFLMTCFLLCPAANTATAGAAQDWFSSRALNGHKLEALPDGDSLTAARLALIEQAQHSIYISAFTYKTDPTAQDFTARLCAKARAGVDVRLLLDGRGSKDFLKKQAKALTACGAHVLDYEPLDWGLFYFRESMHEKLMIVDGQHIITGGSGYAHYYAVASLQTQKWHDLDIKLSGPSACWYHYRFIRNWRKTVGMELPFERKIHTGPAGAKVLEHRYGLETFTGCHATSYGTARVYPVQANPVFDSGSWLLNTHIDAIKASRTSITLYSPYLTPDKRLVNALLDARKRGVEVTIMTNSKKTNDEPKIAIGMLYKAGRLLKAGVKVMIWNRPGMLHRKGGVYDGRWAFFGSDNLDRGAHVYNSENLAFTDDTDFVKAMTAMMASDLEDCVPLTPELIGKEKGVLSFWRKHYIQAIMKYL